MPIRPRGIPSVELNDASDLRSPLIITEVERCIVLEQLNVSSTGTERGQDGPTSRDPARRFMALETV
jgi:hypothetical protein